MADLLSVGERWLAGVQSTSCATTVSYARGARTGTVRLTLGGSLTVAFGTSPVATSVRSAYIPAADMVLRGRLERPESGDVLTWREDNDTRRTFAVGPWGPDRLASRLVESGETWQVYVQEFGELDGRKSVEVVLEKPLDAPTRNSYGETVGERFEAAGEPLDAEVTPLTAAEDVQAGRLLELSKYLVFVTTDLPVTSAWRVTVSEGPLEGKHLYVESVTPLPGFEDELMLVCRMGGA